MPPPKMRRASLGVGGTKCSVVGTTPFRWLRKNHTTQATMVRYTAGAMPAMNMELMDTPADTPYTIMGTEGGMMGATRLALATRAEDSSRL